MTDVWVLWISNTRAIISIGDDTVIGGVTGAKKALFLFSPLLLHVIYDLPLQLAPFGPSPDKLFA
jgi:hypothetical protein